MRPPPGRGAWRRVSSPVALEAMSLVNTVGAGATRSARRPGIRLGLLPLGRKPGTPISHTRRPARVRRVQKLRGLQVITVDAPSLKEIKKSLEDLLASRQTRAEVSAWAIRWITDETWDATEPRVVWGLERLGAVELQTALDEYLYGEQDFHLWLDEIENALDSSMPGQADAI